MNNGNSYRKRICLINLYFGIFPKWFSLFLKCCKSNPEIDFLLFSDQDIQEIRASNIKHILFKMDDFNRLATYKLNIALEIKEPYKICDFKPLYGIIFEDYLINYDFWGYCDNDIIFGKFNDFVLADILDKFDIINTYRGFLSGPFCLYRNNLQIKSLYRKISNYNQILFNTKYIGLDENIQRNELVGITVKKVFYFSRFIIKELFSGRNSLLNIPEIRYQFQWYYKRKMLNNQIPVDMTEAVWKAQKENEIKVFCRELILSEYYFQRKKMRNWHLIYKNGILSLYPKKVNVFGYHFRSSVLNLDFNINDLPVANSFMINRDGIFNNNE